MTLLSICQDVADVVGVQRPSTIVGNSGQQERQLLGFAKETLTELSLMDWPVLSVAYSMNTVVSQAAYDLPSDFEHEISDTMYASARYQNVRGQLSAGEWARQRSTLPDLGMYRFRIYLDPLKLYIAPTPEAVEAVTYEYKTTNRVIHADLSRGSSYTADTDTTLVPEDLVYKGVKWRTRRGLGLDYAEEYNDYEMSRASRLAQQLQFGATPISIRYSDEIITNGYVPENGFG